MTRPLLFLFLAVPLLAQEKSTQYNLRFPNAVHHEAEVRAVFTGIKAPLLEVVMSRSSPGRYALHEFAKNIYNVRASDSAGHLLAITRPNPYAWTVTTSGADAVVFEYTLFGDRVDGTYDGIDETHAHLNMPATLAWAHGFEQAPSRVHFDLPPKLKWKIATELLPEAGDQWTAPNLDRLMDAPVELSNHDSPGFTIEGARFRLSLHHTGTSEEAEHYANLCQAVVLEEEGVFGALPHYDGGTYTFLLDYLPYITANDGMEHRDSTVITGQRDLTTSANLLIGTVAHEFFHSWNVRRIRPKSLEPFDFERANMSGELWFAEGFTNYYGPLVLQRAGIHNLNDFAQTLGGAVDYVLNAPGRKLRSPVEMSQLAPFVDAATAIDPNNFRNTFISYYTYGEALGLGIDLAIREHFPGKSLDDWMRAMWKHHGDVNQPYTLSDLQTALAEATGDASFAELVFEHHIYGREPMDYRALLLPAGLLLRRSQPQTQGWWGSVELTAAPDGCLELKNEPAVDTPSTMPD